MSQSSYIFDVTEETFDRYVLENSFHKPVLVDFWADWCAPCKALMPVLASITESYAGELLMAKVDCDAEAGLSERFGIRSLPTVVLFKDGQPVEGFAGMQPESAIRALLEPHVSLPPLPDAEGGDSEADISAQVDALLLNGGCVQAIALLQQAMTIEPSDKLRLLLGHAYSDNDQLEEAEQVLAEVTDREAHKLPLKNLQAEIGFRRQAHDFPAEALLLERLKHSPQDSEATFQLAILKLAHQDHELALAHLLSLFQHDRSYADGAAQRTLLEVFDILGSEHPLTTQYRRKLYQALY
ncbi:thioredoxin [Halopseudomonas pelagia]|uniref:Thioredoxin n=1 Tax=Halopseudomonas pelagia TaxID=553151 RepID=A0AA91U128_9GAMM|nr:thioredoxin [Halopseudomonas pelagia]PCC98609.1 thioredoxin [Halopseudomonas pelagia]QFY55571.1 thioredoxin [Halopseudomonas pelagia]